MAPTKIGIIYATGSKMIRRIVAPSDDAELDRPGLVSTGESLLLAERPPGGINLDLEAYAESQVQSATGIAPPKIVCAVIPEGGDTVAGMILADPAIDTLPDSLLIEAYSREIQVGCTYDRETGVFTAPERVAKDKDGKDVIVPAKAIEKKAVVP